MIDDDDGILARDWAVGFRFGIGLRSKECLMSILLIKHRQVAARITADSVTGKPSLTSKSLRLMSPPATSAIPLTPPKSASN
jgi:hypothetical protein